MAPLLNPAVVGGGGTPAKIDDDTYAAAYPASVSAAQPAPATGPGDAGYNSSSRPPPPWPTLKLDSGASIHVVGDARLLSNLRDAPAGKTIVVADGNTLPVTKIGDIQIVNPAFTIPGVYLAPGLKADLSSVRQLTRMRICTWFDGDRAVLYVGCELVGEAIAPKENPSGLYVLQFLSVPKEVPVVASSFGNNGLDMMSVPNVPTAPSSTGNDDMDMSVPEVPAAASSSGNNGLDMSMQKVPTAPSSSGNNGLDTSVTKVPTPSSLSGKNDLDMSVPKVSAPASSSGSNNLDMSMPKVPVAASSSGNNGLEMSVAKVPESDSISGNNGLDNGEIKLVPVSCGSKSSCGSFGSVLCRLKAFLRVRLFCTGRKEKPTREPHREVIGSCRRTD